MFFLSRNEVGAYAGGRADNGKFLSLDSSKSRGKKTNTEAIKMDYSCIDGEKIVVFSQKLMLAIDLNIRKTIMIHGRLGDSLTAELELPRNLTAIKAKFLMVFLCGGDDDDAE